MQIVDDRIISFYDTYQLNIELVDHANARKHEMIEFQAVNIREYEMILEYFWLNDIDLDIKWREQIWTYRDSSILSTKSSNVRICIAKKFAQLTLLTVKEKDETYIVISY